MQKRMTLYERSVSPKRKKIDERKTLTQQQISSRRIQVSALATARVAAARSWREEVDRRVVGRWKCRWREGEEEIRENEGGFSCCLSGNGRGAGREGWVMSVRSLVGQNSHWSFPEFIEAFSERIGGRPWRTALLYTGHNPANRINRRQHVERLQVKGGFRHGGILCIHPSIDPRPTSLIQARHSRTNLNQTTCCKLLILTGQL